MKTELKCHNCGSERKVALLIPCPTCQNQPISVYLAAPELLDVLKKIDEWARDHKLSIPYRIKHKEAIAKAEGN